MSSKPITAWMWQDGNYTRGAMLEREDNTIEWLMNTPCNCSAETVVQPIADFLDQGAPRHLSVPDDIMAEITHSIAQLTAVSD